MKLASVHIANWKVMHSVIMRTVIYICLLYICPSSQTVDTEYISEFFTDNVLSLISNLVVQYLLVITY